MFINVIPESDINKYKKQLDSQEFILFKLEKYEWKNTVQTKI